MVKRRIAIVGAGVGGLAAALRLTANDFDVTLFERAASPGGKMREVAIGDFRLDAEPTVFTMLGIRRIVCGSQRILCRTGAS